MVVLDFSKVLGDFELSSFDHNFFLDFLVLEVVSAYDFFNSRLLRNYLYTVQIESAKICNF